MATDGLENHTLQDSTFPPHPQTLPHPTNPHFGGNDQLLLIVGSTHEIDRYKEFI